MFDDYPQNQDELPTEVTFQQPTVDASPDVEEDALPNQFSPDFISAEVFGNLFGTSLVALAVCIGLIVLAVVEGIDWQFLSAGAGGICIIAILVGLSVVYPRIWFRNARWQLKKNSLEIQRGVLWQNRIAIPLGRVQHADVSQGPLLRYFNLGKLTIHTAGTSSATIEMDGLSHATAMRLRDELVKQTVGQTVT